MDADAGAGGSRAPAVGAGAGGGERSAGAAADAAVAADGDCNRATARRKALFLTVSRACSSGGVGSDIIGCARQQPHHIGGERARTRGGGEEIVGQRRERILTAPANALVHNGVTAINQRHTAARCRGVVHIGDRQGADREGEVAQAAHGVPETPVVGIPAGAELGVIIGQPDNSRLAGRIFGRGPRIAVIAQSTVSARGEAPCGDE